MQLPEFAKRYSHRWGREQAAAKAENLFYTSIYRWGFDSPFAAAYLEAQLQGRIINELQIISWGLIAGKMEQLAEQLSRPDPAGIYPHDCEISRGGMRVPYYAPLNAHVYWRSEDSMPIPDSITMSDIFWRLQRITRTHTEKLADGSLITTRVFFWSLSDDYGNIIIGERPYDWIHRVN